jgi:hypothetical protein
VHLHGTAGCVGGWAGSLNVSARPHGAPVVGYRCCDTSPFALQHTNG